MPEFILDTHGGVRLRPDNGGIRMNTLWGDLDAFTQGYIKALFFTEQGAWLDAITEDEKQAAYDEMVEGLGFSDLAPEALVAIVRDCAKFQAGRAWSDALEGYGGADEHHAGCDFWYTRNGHGCGFWDGDWPEPYATQLTEAAKAFGEVDVYLDDVGGVHLS